MHARNTSSAGTATGPIGGLPLRALNLSLGLLLGSGIALLILKYGAGSG
jgi:hypothetical protein